MRIYWPRHGRFGGENEGKDQDSDSRPDNHVDGTAHYLHCDGSLMDKPPCETCRDTCCHNLPMHRTELETLQKNRPRKLNKLKIKNIGGGHIFLTGQCPWLTKDRKCAAYESRPIICRVIGTEGNPCAKQPGFEEEFDVRMQNLKQIVEKTASKTGQTDRLNVLKKQGIGIK